MISGVHGCLLWFVAAGGALAEADALVRLEGSLAQALEANERLAALVERQREEIARLGEQLAARDGELLESAIRHAPIFEREGGAEAREACAENRDRQAVFLGGARHGRGDRTEG